jgi:uncharacterized membrane protein
MKPFKHIIDLIKKELKLLIYIFIALVAIFKIVFYKEDILILIRIVFGIYWLFLLPGFLIMYLWKENFTFIERLIFGCTLGIALTGLISYYLSLIEFNIRLHFFIIPLIIITISFVLIYYNEKLKK